MEDLFAKIVPLPRPKRFGYQKPTPFPRPRKLVHSAIKVSAGDMYKFVEKEMKTKRPFTKKNCYDRLTHHIPEPIKNLG